jgi:hypothetical protein
MERRLSFGDAAIDARLLSSALAVAPEAIVEKTVDRVSILDRAFADQRFRHQVESMLASRIADLAGRDDSPLSLPVLLTSADFLRTRASGPSTARLALSLARSALNIGLTDMALDLLGTSFDAEAAALAAKIPMPPPTSVEAPASQTAKGGVHSGPEATPGSSTSPPSPMPNSPGAAPQPVLPDDDLRMFVARYLDIASAIASAGEAVERFTAEIDQRIRPRHPAAADRLAALVAEATAGFVRDAAGLDGIRKTGAASPEARLLERIRQPDLAGKPGP